MKLIGRKLLADYKSKYIDTQSPLDVWEAEVQIAEWKTPHDIKRRYSTASFLPKNQVIFNIKGNQHRIHTMVEYKNGIVLIKNIGPHDEYMKWSFK